VIFPDLTQLRFHGAAADPGSTTRLRHAHRGEDDGGRTKNRSEKIIAGTKENGPYIANGAMRRNTGMGASDLKGWFSELAVLDNPVRREFHLFTLLSGSRPAALQQIKPNQIDFRTRTLHVPKPKGSSKRAFDIPLSREMILCLASAISVWETNASTASTGAGISAGSASGHIAETKEDRDDLSKWGNELRQTFRTIATQRVFPRLTPSA
jgi:hypothetical protein